VSVRVLIFAIGLLGLAALGAPDRRSRDTVELGLAVELPRNPGPEAEERLLTQLRTVGVSAFAVEVSWPEAEPAPGRYRVQEAIHVARIFRQSGATVHLDLPLVAGREKRVPVDLSALAFDDPKLSLRLGRLLDALEPALPDVATVSLGYEADVYFSDKPEELEAYRRLFVGAVDFLRKKAPDVLVGVTTLAPTDSPAPIVAARLHQPSPVLFYLYAPFEPGQPFVHRPPSSLELDWKRLLEASRGRPIAFPEVSYSSSRDNGSSPEKQAEFVRRMRAFVAAADGKRLLFARYATLRDEPAASQGETPVAVRRNAFFANRGLQKADGTPKPAWKEFVARGN
jgi:hypothetical protein